MLSLRDTPLTCDDDEKLFPYPEGRQKRSCTIFLGYTSNLVTSGLREVRKSTKDLHKS